MAVTGVRDRRLLTTLGGVIVDMPSLLDVRADCSVREIAEGRALALVGLAARTTARCHELSNDERWRLGLARALTLRRSPVVVDCTRGTTATAATLGALLLDLRNAGLTVYAITDDAELAGYADRIITAYQGYFVAAGPSGAATLDRTRVIHELLRRMT